MPTIEPDNRIYTDFPPQVRDKINVNDLPVYNDENTNLVDDMPYNEDRNRPNVVFNEGAGEAVKTAKGVLKDAQLPTQGKIRYVPPEKWTPSQPLPKQNGGIVDKFGNVWTKGPSRTNDQAFEWDVQLSKTGKSQLGWASRDGSHLNISLDGKITHK